ncbi:MAG: hypothetical protein H8D97_00375 [Proteobacteria bacterium]|nr:hypothetical protein [Pseudomonadota bacterium]
MSVSDREVIASFISSKYDDEPDKKRRLINLFFSGEITNQEYQEVIETIAEISNQFRSKIGDTTGYNLGNKESRQQYLYSLTGEQRLEYLKFNENIRRVFDFKIGPKESNLNFRMGPQSSYFYIELDHYIIDERIKKKINYNENKKTHSKTKECSYKPTVYINCKHRLFRNILNYLKGRDLLDEFIFGFEEKVLIVI